ncbi:hypothetical protein [Simiduia agarivorans]|uniref:Uncharacterized protein n=1 Tax=Simiduia agarivorans (strain DSM 21679 / JCM 13881 / BCRC 17597 / SA1) TaxID=1117647 RepID=K4L025_SIMAS|nr:hypothetical protein [Simiduia agarivorans]AFU99527.1 hypothetical protein M5M_11750 [Simiduia agarivorans SA1 = DSM 21679]
MFTDMKKYLALILMGYCSQAYSHASDFRGLLESMILLFIYFLLAVESIVVVFLAAKRKFSGSREYLVFVNRLTGTLIFMALVLLLKIWWIDQESINRYNYELSAMYFISSGFVAVVLPNLQKLMCRK